ncbi:hypothetical protein [Salinicola acroporae]|uniref:hypothetical protein n=1 Tax=Salinicola acroporae TaxID=1541440 RepID=UPI0013A63978|nr:hypothetical protein [Salinicola acroporae]
MPIKPNNNSDRNGPTADNNNNAALKLGRQIATGPITTTQAQGERGHEQQQSSSSRRKNQDATLFVNEATTTSFLVIWRLPGTTTTTGKGHCLSWLDYCFEYEVVAVHSMADNDKPVTASSFSDCGAYSRRCAITNKKKRHGRCEAFLQGEAHRASPFTILILRFPSASFVLP